MTDDWERLRHIEEAISRIEQEMAESREAFDQNEMVQVWVVHFLQRIGEASRALSLDFKTRHPEVPWADLVAFRNIIVHEYFRIDLEVVWRIVQEELPALKARIAAMLDEGSAP